MLQGVFTGVGDVLSLQSCSAGDFTCYCRASAMNAGLGAARRPDTLACRAEGGRMYDKRAAAILRQWCDGGWRSMKARCITALLILSILLLAGCQALAAVTKVGADINQNIAQTVMAPQAVDD